MKNLVVTVTVLLSLFIPNVISADSVNGSDTEYGFNTDLPYINKYTSQNVSAIMRGDVNADGHLSVFDIAFFKKAVLSKNSSVISKESADIDGNGSITATDFKYIAQYLRGSITEFPVIEVKPEDLTLSLTVKYMTRNDCYKENKFIIPQGIMVHSTAEPGIMAGDWFDLWNRSYTAKEIDREVCVHSFVDNKEAYQYLPWTMRGWHAGGAANNTHIGIEICEPAGHFYNYSYGPNMFDYNVENNEKYFRDTWDNTVALCVMLCRKYGLTEKNIISHSEGYQQGTASNHADPMHWFPKHNESMDSFRAAVKKVLESGQSVVINN
jgi:hypothetical protein